MNTQGQCEVSGSTVPDEARLAICDECHERLDREGRITYLPANLSTDGAPVVYADGSEIEWL